MQFEERVAFKIQPEIVWARASDVPEIPRYWHGTKSLEITRREGEEVRARVRFAFGGSGEVRISVDNQHKRLTIYYLSGPFRGEEVVSVQGDEVSATWDVKFTGFFRLLPGWNGAHFRSGTKHALERLTGVDARDGRLGSQQARVENA